MDTAILLVAVGLAAGVCPAVAWIQRRRGRSGCVPRQAPGDLASIRAERARLAGRIAALEDDTARRSQ